MRLKDLLKFDEIVIQCHDNPDADAIACGYAVLLYLQKYGKSPSLVYGGRNFIRKTNLVMMIEDLEIPITHVTAIGHPELLLMVDCQYGGGNAEKFEAQNIAVIDHHRISTNLPELSEVKSNLGACSTLIWQMLKNENFNVTANKRLGTALSYGLYTDTSGFTEIVHPLDKDLRDEANVDNILMAKYRNANMSLEDLEVAGVALLNSDYMDEYRALIVKAGHCDPNILGVISDMVLEVDAVDICIVFNFQGGGVKFSVRSCIKEVNASELAAELSKDIGSGGGHWGKAGGFLSMPLLTKEYTKFCQKRNFEPRMEFDDEGKWEHPSLSGVKAVLSYRFEQYMNNTDIIYAKEYPLDQKNANTYYRRKIPWGYVHVSELYEDGTPITVRTLWGDVDTVVEKGIVLTIGPRGGVYFRKEKAFEEQFYMYPDWKFQLKDVEYSPTFRNQDDGTTIEPVDYIHVCIPKGKRAIYAKRLEHKVKLFQEKNGERVYTLGREGDYLVNSTEQQNQIYVMQRKIFEETYRKADETMKQKAVIFDLDGTLLNTLEDLKDATNAALESKGMPVCTLEQVRQYVGNGVRKLMIRAVPDGEKNPLFEETFAAFKEYYGAHCLDHTAPYPDIMQMMKALKENGVKIAIVSNKLDSAVKELNKQFFAAYTTSAIGEMDGVAHKPAPDMVNKALRELGVDKEDAVYVGDSDVDIATAKNSGLPCISVTWGFRDVEFLKEHGAKRLIESPLELLYLV